MKIHLLSDLHLEFQRGPSWKPEPLDVDVVILAGDISSHNYTFLRQVRNWFNFLNRGSRGSRNRARFYMLKVALSDGHRASSIQEMDPFLKDYESEYHYLFKRIVDGSKLAEDGPLAAYYELPNLARRLLESFLIFKVPNEGTLHARLEAVAYDGPQKTRILRFVDTHSHAEQISEANDDVSALAEAPAVLRDLLDLMRMTDESHYNGMMEAIAA